MIRGPAPAAAVVLVSGGGTNLQAIIDAAAAGAIDIELRAVLSNRPGAYGLERAAAAGLETRVLEARDYDDRADYDAALAAEIDSLGADLIVLAGFMRILSPDFVARFAGRILNIHPSLLPDYPGLDTHRRVLAAGEREHGATVHFVTAKLDGGPRIIRARVPVLEGDDPARLAARVLEQEHRIYPEAIRLVAGGRVRYEAGKAFLDGRELAEPLDFESAP